MKVFSSLAILLVCCWVIEIHAGGKTDKPLDRDFLIKAATCNNAEIEISKLADKRANSTQVKDFATALGKEHKAAYDKLGELFKTRKIGVVAGVEKETTDEIKRLGKLEGVEFERAFLQHMIQEHKKAITVFENQAKNGREEDIRGYAKEMLPDLRRHLSKAEDLARSVGK